MYPKVKVREQGQDDQLIVKEESSLLLLKVLESLSLKEKDHRSPDSITDLGKEYQNDSPRSVARIPKSYVPNMATPSVPVSKGIGKNNKEINEDAKVNIRAGSVPRPRAVLSSPDNDDMIGSRNQISKKRPLLRKHNLVTTTTTPQGKVHQNCVKAETPVNIIRRSKEAIDSKFPTKEKKVSEPIISRPKVQIRTGKTTSKGI